MSMTSERTLFVTGASGHLGRRVVELLLEKGGDKIVAGTRKPEKLADLAARGVVVRQVTLKIRRDWRRR
jgi:NAD(P)H dehydrogenase (quinone)